MLQFASLEADPPMGSDWTETELRRMRALSGALPPMKNAAPSYFSGVVLGFVTVKFVGETVIQF